MQLLSSSSLGDQDAREQRLDGRREISEFETHLSYEHLDLDADSATESDAVAECVFDMKVADELELRGNTFEAELRYRTLAPNPEAVSRVALLLDAKGFSEEALMFYARAARANDSNAMWRLAVISRTVGRKDLADDFAQLANCHMPDRDRRELNKTLRLLSRNRHEDDLGRTLAVAVLNEHPIDATYALGSILFVMSGRSDLARLAYCSALSRGHSLAAVSLLDLPVHDTKAQLSASRSLEEVVDPEFHHRAREARSLPGTRGFERFTTALSNEVCAEPLSELLHTVQQHAKDSDRTAAMQRILSTTRTVNSLRGYVRVGYDTNSLKLIHEANDRVCSQVREVVEDGLVSNEPSLIQKIWSAGAVELKTAKTEARRLASGEGRQPVTRVTSAGTVSRFGRAFVDLPAEERRVLILRVSGVSAEEVAQVMGYESAGKGRSVFLRAAVRLRKEQMGEQFDPKLWKEVESCFDEMPTELRALFDRLQDIESETR